jgi:hypothetical protein
MNVISKANLPEKKQKPPGKDVLLEALQWKL